MVPLPRRSYFLYVTRKDFHPSRAWRGTPEDTLLGGSQVSVQRLGTGTTSTSLTMQIATLLHTLTMAITKTSLFQVESKIKKQSWPALTISPQMKWKCFILVELPS